MEQLRETLYVALQPSNSNCAASCWMSGASASSCTVKCEKRWRSQLKIPNISSILNDSDCLQALASDVICQLSSSVGDSNAHIPGKNVPVCPSPTYLWLWLYLCNNCSRPTHNASNNPTHVTVENPILEKVWSGASGQTLALPTKKKVSEQMEVASVNSQKGPQVGTSAFPLFLINPIERTVRLTFLIDRLLRVLIHYSWELKVRGVIRFS